jgi:thiosulfate reductase cytochrome b subunit
LAQSAEKENMSHTVGGQDNPRHPPDISKRQDGPKARRRFVYRHAFLVRVTHWINVLCLVLLLMSGLQIFNAHPALYWGETSKFGDPAFAITTKKDGNGETRGVIDIAGRQVDTTGWLGVSRDSEGDRVTRAFPAWATLPSWQSLAEGRLWHFFFAWIFVLNGLIYVLYSVLSGHLWRDLFPSRRDLGRLGRTIWDHLRLRFPAGEEALRYNVLQQMSYVVVVLVLLPVLLLAGLAMSPRLDAAFPELIEIFGGRQSARTVHFIAALALVAFVLVHVFMVLVSGVWNKMRSMITGRYTIKTGGGNDA